MKLIVGYKGSECLPAFLPGAGHVKAQDRSVCKIGVVDDEAFAPAKNLASFGYNIKELYDLKRLNEVDGFDILLVDLNGVGKNFDPHNQGAVLIKEIRRNYPAIFVSAYSSAADSDPIARYAKQYADVFIKKDEEIENICRKVDELIAKSSSPAVVWQRVRLSLVQENISTKALMGIEDAFVRSIMNKDVGGASIISEARKFNLAEQVLDIIKSLTASYIFRAVAGG